jgi:hypothetical protein
VLTDTEYCFFFPLWTTLFRILITVFPTSHSIALILTTVSLKMAVFWVVAPCSLVEVYQRFKGPCCRHHQSDELLIPEASHLRTHRRENLKSYLVSLKSAVQQKRTYTYKTYTS